jgi:hypothetical protein
MPRRRGVRVSRAIRQEAGWPGFRGLSALGGEGHECNATGTLDRCAELALMSRAIARDPARNDFTSLGDQITQTFNIFIIDISNLVRTEAADLLAGKTPFRCHSLLASFMPATATLCVMRRADGRF